MSRVQKQCMKWTDISYLLRSPLARKVIEAIEKEPLTPAKISKISGVNRSHVSNKLAELVERKLVECLNPNDYKWRFYQATNHGRTVLSEVRKAK